MKLPEYRVIVKKNIAPIPEHDPKDCTYYDCYRCCETCNYDKHICPFCGDYLSHDSYRTIASLRNRNLGDGKEIGDDEVMLIQRRHLIKDCRPDLEEE